MVQDLRDENGEFTVAALNGLIDAIGEDTSGTDEYVVDSGASAYQQMVPFFAEHGGGLESFRLLGLDVRFHVVVSMDDRKACLDCLDNILSQNVFLGVPIVLWLNPAKGKFIFRSINGGDTTDYSESALCAAHGDLPGSDGRIKYVVRYPDACSYRDRAKIMSDLFQSGHTIPEVLDGTHKMPFSVRLSLQQVWRPLCETIGGIASAFEERGVVA